MRYRIDLSRITGMACDVHLSLSMNGTLTTEDTMSHPLYSYEMQCWVVDNIVQRCGHPENMDCTCFGRHWQGWDLDTAMRCIELNNTTHTGGTT